MNAKTKLIEILHGQCWNEWDPSVTRSIPGSICAELANAIIAAFPQIEKQPVRLNPTQFNVPHSKRYGFEQLDRFLSDEDRMQWLEKHYCEVFE